MEWDAIFACGIIGFLVLRALWWTCKEGPDFTKGWRGYQSEEEEIRELEEMWKR